MGLPPSRPRPPTSIPLWHPRVLPIVRGALQPPQCPQPAPHLSPSAPWLWSSRHKHSSSHLKVLVGTSPGGTTACQGHPGSEGGPHVISKAMFTLERAVSGTLVAAASNASLHTEPTVLAWRPPRPPVWGLQQTNSPQGRRSGLVCPSGSGPECGRWQCSQVLRAGLTTRAPFSSVRLVSLLSPCTPPTAAPCKEQGQRRVGARAPQGRRGSPRDGGRGTRPADPLPGRAGARLPAHSLLVTLGLLSGLPWALDAPSTLTEAFSEPHGPPPPSPSEAPTATPAHRAPLRDGSPPSGSEPICTPPSPTRHRGSREEGLGASASASPVPGAAPRPQQTPDGENVSVKSTEPQPREYHTHSAGPSSGPRGSGAVNSRPSATPDAPCAGKSQPGRTTRNPAQGRRSLGLGHGRLHDAGESGHV